MRVLAVAGLALALSGCEPTGDVGYVEIKTVPAPSNVAPPSLYLDTLKVAPLKTGSAVLRQRVGTTRLASDPAGNHVLCDIVVKKNRITTVTISVLERPPRCQCRNGGGARRTCVS